MFILVCVCIYMYAALILRPMCVNVCICVTFLCAYVYVCTPIVPFVYLRTCKCVYVYVYMPVCVVQMCTCTFLGMHIYLLMHIRMNDCACYVWINVCVQCCMYMCVFWNILDCQYTADIVILYKENQLWLQTSHIILSEQCLTQYLASWIIPSNISGICSSKRKQYNPSRHWTSWTCVGP